MKFATGLKNVEIAELMGISESNVGVLAHRAAKKLKQIMAREEKCGSHEK
jgi:RNA polymerase sigma-70 factor (ECF subfamily)